MQGRAYFLLIRATHQSLAGGGARVEDVSSGLFCPSMAWRLMAWHSKESACIVFSRRRGGGAYSFVACLSSLAVDHASLSRRSTAPTPNKILL